MSEPIPIQNVLLAVIEGVDHQEKRLNNRQRAQRVPLSEWVRASVLMRDGFQCLWCEAKGIELHVDHIVPVAMGGTDATDNLRTLCRYCNMGRSNFQTDAFTARAPLITNGCTGCCYDEDAVAWGWWDEPASVAVWCRYCKAQGMTTEKSADSWRSEQINHQAYAA